VDVQLVTQYIVRQTTVLLAQVATTSGVRAPLSQVADQVFFELARELEAQGVRRNVVADMFGLALRSYQLKMQRLADTSGVQRSLWQDLYRQLEQTSSSRRELAERFGYVEAKAVRAVLNDLVDSGLAYKSGRGEDAVYGLTTQSERQRLQQAGSVASLSNLLWLVLSTQGPLTREQLEQSFAVPASTVASAIQRLCADGRITESGGALVAESFEIPVGTEEGWEAAMCDHFRAVATAIGKKLATRGSQLGDTIGGATLTFTVHESHPRRAEVHGLLQRVRGEVGELWREVVEHNREHPPPPDAERVTFYFGQNVTPNVSEAAEVASAAESK
jgi:predicted transcriptional regulator